MSAERLRQIGRYLRPHRRQVALGAGALRVVNLLGVAIPLQVRSVVNGLQEGFSLEAVLRQALLIVTMATVMGAVRLWSRMLVFGVGRQVEADLKQRIFDHVLLQDPYESTFLTSLKALFTRFVSSTTYTQFVSAA
jgi:ATP-binding cassette subfamily B protein